MTRNKKASLFDKSGEAFLFLVSGCKGIYFFKICKQTFEKNVQKKHVRLSDKTRTCFLKKTYVFF